MFYQSACTHNLLGRDIYTLHYLKLFPYFMVRLTIISKICVGYIYIYIMLYHRTIINYYEYLIFAYKANKQTFRLTRVYLRIYFQLNVLQFSTVRPYRTYKFIIILYKVNNVVAISRLVKINQILSVEKYNLIGYNIIKFA